MTKQINGWFIVMALAVIVGLGLYTVTAATPTPTPVPSPIMTYSKFSQAGENYIAWILVAQNSGNADSDSQTVQDTLPAGADWTITQDGIGCELVPSLLPNRVKLSCNPFIVQKRHINAEGSNFVNGSRSVIIGGVVDKCGDYNNVAIFNFLTIRQNTATVDCPATPTPTTPITTPEPTTPVPTSTQPISTPTPRITPLPPNTGNAEPAGVRDGTYDIIFISSILILTGLIVASYSSRRNRK